jgi:hypothetical protein
MKRQIRQGDVLLVAVDKKPPAGIEAKIEVVLAEGELTGHVHLVQAKEVLEWSEGDQRYIRVTSGEPGVLSHEDHDPVPAAVLEPGITYRVIPQQEWDLQGQWRKVTD